MEVCRLCLLEFPKNILINVNLISKFYDSKNGRNYKICAVMNRCFMKVQTPVKLEQEFLCVKCLNILCQFWEKKWIAMHVEFKNYVNKHVCRICKDPNPVWKFTTGQDQYRFYLDFTETIQNFALLTLCMKCNEILSNLMKVYFNYKKISTLINYYGALGNGSGPFSLKLIKYWIDERAKLHNKQTLVKNQNLQTGNNVQQPLSPPYPPPAYQQPPPPPQNTALTTATQIEELIKKKSETGQPTIINIINVQATPEMLSQLKPAPSKPQNTCELILNDICTEFVANPIEKIDISPSTTVKFEWNVETYTKLYDIISGMNLDFTEDGMPIKPDWGDIYEQFQKSLKDYGGFLDLQGGWQRLIQMAQQPKQEQDLKMTNLIEKIDKLTNITSNYNLDSLCTVEKEESWFTVVSVETLNEDVKISIVDLTSDTEDEVIIIEQPKERRKRKQRDPKNNRHKAIKT